MTRSDASHAPNAGDRDEVDLLRRRLYRPDASAVDLAAYRAAVPSVAVPEGTRSAAPVSRVRSRRGLGPVVASVLATAVTAAVALLASPRPAEVAVAVPGPRPTTVDPGGRGRDALLGSLSSGDGAGLLRLIVRDPAVAAALPGDRRTAIERHGAGPATIDLPPTTRVVGRVTVLLVTGSDGGAGWRASRLVIHDDRTIHLATAAERGGPQRAGVPTVATFRVGSGGPPLRLLVRVPARVRWDVAIVGSA